MPRISLITPCYNVARWVPEMIASVQRQTFSDWEHILVDDGSTDDTAEVVERAIRNEPRQRLHRQSNMGVCGARNTGYRLSDPSSEYVYFPDPDDLLHPEMLETMVKYLDAHPDVGLAYCDYSTLDESGAEMRHDRPPRYVPSRFGVRALPEDEPRTPFVSIYCWASIPEAVAVMRRCAYDRTTGWDESFGQHGESVVLFPQFALRGEVHRVPVPLYAHRVREGQSSVGEGKQSLAERKVVEWWKQATGLTAEQRAIVNEAEWFRYYRLEPWKGVRTAVADMRRGRVGRALRFGAGAVRRYAMSFVTRQPWILARHQ